MATTPALPSVITNVIKWMVKHPDAMADPWRYLYDYVSSQDPAQDLVWRRLMFTFTRVSPATTQEDTAVFDLHISNITGGQLDTSWTSGDYTTVDTHLQEFWTALRPFINQSHTLRDIRYYVASFNPQLIAGDAIKDPKYDDIRGKRFNRAGPPQHVFIPTGLTGGDATSPSAYQVAMSVTFKTPGPRHWGRCYLPGVPAGELGQTYGRFSSSVTQAVANIFAELQDDLLKSDFQMVVPTTQHEGLWYQSLQSINHIVVDDVPDVIRRRRPKQASVRSEGVPTA